jgi:hypothetical protein
MQSASGPTHVAVGHAVGGVQVGKLLSVQLLPPFHGLGSMGRAGPTEWSGAVCGFLMRVALCSQQDGAVPMRGHVQGLEYGRMSWGLIRLPGWLGPLHRHFEVSTPVSTLKSGQQQEVAALLALPGSIAKFPSISGPGASRCVAGLTCTGLPPSHKPDRPWERLQGMIVCICLFACCRHAYWGAWGCACRLHSPTTHRMLGCRITPVCTPSM